MRHSAPPTLGLIGLLLLSACAGRGVDWDLRGGANGLNTGGAGLGTAATPPNADANGIIAYSGYQAVRAKEGETVGQIATRIGLGADELAKFNALKVDSTLREGELLVLPRAVAAPLGAPAAGGLDVTAIATTALDRVDTSATPLTPLPAPAAAATPARHKVARGETAFGIARTYNVSAKSLAEWNGLGPDMGVREGQTLLIPTLNGTPPKALDDTANPGAGSATPTPPSALKPLPLEETLPAATAKAEAAKPAADLSGGVTGASAAAFAMPANGKIIRGYVKKKNDGIDIGAAAGSPVKAAGAGTVAAVTKDTAGTPIVVIRHDGGLLTVYAGVEGLNVAKGDSVKRGQTIATVRASGTPFLHFEVRKGVESVDPMGYLQ